MVYSASPWSCGQQERGSIVLEKEQVARRDGGGQCRIARLAANGSIRSTEKRRVQQKHTPKAQDGEPASCLASTGAVARGPIRSPSTAPRLIPCSPPPPSSLLQAAEPELETEPAQPVVTHLRVSPDLLTLVDTKRQRLIYVVAVEEGPASADKVGHVCGAVTLAAWQRMVFCSLSGAGFWR